MKNESAENLLKDIRNLEILESIGEAVSIQDTNFKIIFQNKICKEIMGNHTGKYCYEAYALKDKTCKDCPLFPVFADGKIHTVERNKPSDKGIVYLEITASPLKDSSGKIIAGIEFVRDISKQKSEEKERKNLNELLKNITSLQTQFIADVEPNILFDKLLNNILSLTKSEYGFIGEIYNDKNEPYLKTHAISNIAWDEETKNFYEKNAPNGLEFSNLKTLFGRVITSGKPVISNKPSEDSRRGGLPKGHPPLNSFLGLPLYYGKELIGMVGIANRYKGYDENLIEFLEPILETCSHIIEGYKNKRFRKLAEEALKESEERFRKLVETAFEGIAIAENGIFLEANELFAKLFEYTLSEIIGLHVSKLVAPESLDDVMQKIQSGYDRPYEAVCVTKNGKHFPVEVCGKAVIYNGRKARMTALRDLTERKKLEEEFIKIQKLESLGILAGGIAHDFNNLLTAILGNVSLAKMHINPENKIYELLAEAEKASMRAKDLTQQLLTFSKGGEPIKKTVSLKELVHDMACFALRGSKTKCECRLPDNLWPVEIDEGQIIQVLHNLIINADHAMPEGGVVNIHAENITSTDDETGVLLMPGKYVKISVHDNGIGIPKNHLQKIFDPYFTTKQKGSGLGLTTAFSIIKKHDGTITVESEPGKGTVFHIYLPASSKEVIAHEKTNLTSFSGKGKILVMDDEDMVRDVAGEILRSLGYKVEFVKDGAKAIELYQKARKSGESFDAVIMDLTIQGGMGGREAIKKLLIIDPHVKAVVSSGYSNDSIMSNFKDYGFSAVISKPYTVAEMSKTLHEVINNFVN